MNSYAGRVWLLPSPSWSFQLSAGHLAEAEPGDAGTRADVDRITASATHHRVVNGRVAAVTVAWGRNREDHGATHAATAEASFDLTSRHTLFARGEIAQKSAGDLALPFHAHDPFRVGKVQVGYTRWLGSPGGLNAGIGGAVGVSVVPETLRSSYGGRSAAETAVFVTVRPKAMAH
jgi:hypothetical protein